MEACLVLITLSLCVHLVSGQVMGATGATGQRGQPGLPGPEGQTGASGPQGPPGPPGLPAFQVQYDIERWSGTGGWPGPSGPTGATGMRGAEGATGATGPPGWVGSTGATGMIGGTGVTGATGAPGVIGATGWVGTAYSFYLRGAPGVKGPPGATGAPGSEGLLGAKGMMGLPGLAGPAGPPGAPGQLIFDQPTAQSPVCPEFEPLVRAYQVVYREWDEPWVRHVLNPYVLAIMLGWLLLLTVCVIIAVVAGTCCDRPVPAKIIKDIEMNPAPAYDQIDAVPQSETHSKYESDADFVDKYDDLVDAKLADDDQKADVKPDF